MKTDSKVTLTSAVKLQPRDLSDRLIHILNKAYTIINDPINVFYDHFKLIGFRSPVCKQTEGSLVLFQNPLDLWGGQFILCIDL